MKEVEGRFNDLLKKMKEITNYVVCDKFDEKIYTFLIESEETITNILRIVQAKPFECFFCNAKVPLQEIIYDMGIGPHFWIVDNYDFYNYPVDDNNKIIKEYRGWTSSLEDGSILCPSCSGSDSDNGYSEIERLKKELNIEKEMI